MPAAGLRIITWSAGDVETGVGHWPQLEAPEVINEALLGFLKNAS